MRYVSTRGGVPPVDFADVLLAGLAADGGLYLPEAWPELSAADLTALRGQPYAHVAQAVLAPFVGDAVPAERLAALLTATYRDGPFAHAATAPLVQLTSGMWLLELFHGPTLAFKDYALQLLGRLFDEVLAARGERLTVIGATSGDTGSAAIEACRDRANIDVVILYPQGRVSEVQRRQMTTVAAENVHTLAIDGDFDACQDIVKALFADPQARAELGLGAVNSINWARIVAQAAYYVQAGLALGAPERAVSFAVPTGNFGNVYAAHVARRMGLPIQRLILGTNVNDVLHRFLADGTMTAGAVTPSLSPSMDIQIPSNFERLLVELLGGDSAAVEQCMAERRRTGGFQVPESALTRMRGAGFHTERLDDAATTATMESVYRRTGQLVDPHTAVGIGAAESVGPAGDEPLICLGCAHPAKFPEAVDRATGRWPHLPPRVSDLFDRPERTTPLPNDRAAVLDYLRRNSRAAG